MPREGGGVFVLPSKHAVGALRAGLFLVVNYIVATPLFFLGALCGGLAIATRTLLNANSWGCPTFGCF